ncbi:MAG: glutamine--fructose-6-phosphate transaminase (isomerizing) [Bacteroidia bacterium]|nr:MAG: glutamine--fructose-6-phosphate transaminase (isomerizing) [Bacteroidia bacterium]
MCGIVGYIGHREAYPVVIEGLRKLEYRGYDSAGVSVLDAGQARTYKCKGDVASLVEFIGPKDHSGTLAIGHTRWATHGEPSDVNAHPHTSMNGKVILVHNGIIENYKELKGKLIRRGYTFETETDTEVLANLIEYIYIRGNIPLEMAVRLALTKVIGAYALCIYTPEDRETLVIARLGSPLIIGVGKGEYFVASDATPISEYTQSVIMLNDGDMAVLQREGLQLKNTLNEVLTPEVQLIDWDVENASLGSYEHYMLKEIFEQPRSIGDTLRGRIDGQKGAITLGGLYSVLPRLCNARRIIIVACGTSWHAGLVGEYLIEDLARIPVDVEYASEFRYRDPIIYPDDIVLAITQSGETADTLAAIKLAKSKGALPLAICNVVGSSISRETVAGVYTHAGPEIGVASTKAFTAQVAVLALLALKLGEQRGTLSAEDFATGIDEILSVPAKVEKILEKNEEIRRIAEAISGAHNSLFLGRGYFFPVALEGALKLKEISYIHAEGYPAAEMKHGPIALIDENMPVIIVAGKDKSYEKVVSNVQEVKARKGRVIAVVTEGDELIREMADYCIEIPHASFVAETLLAIVPLQLLAYHVALLLGRNVDRPRNLAKSVTVE